MRDHYPQCHQQHIPRDRCYVCNIEDGATYVYNPAAKCPACGSPIPMSGHTCPGLTERATR